MGFASASLSLALAAQQLTCCEVAAASWRSSSRSGGAAASRPQLQPLQPPWRSGSEFPEPLQHSAECGKLEQELQEEAQLGVTARLCDPGRLLEGSEALQERHNIWTALLHFEHEFSTGHLGSWGVSVGLAVVRDTAVALPSFASSLAEAWGLADPRGVMLVLQLGPLPAMAVAGGLRLAETWLGPSWQSAAEAAMAGPLRAGRPGAAVEAVLQAMADVIGGGTGWGYEAPFSETSNEQRLRDQWTSEYQQGEIWENRCGDERCLELFLDDVRQTSARFEKYYHEALVFPAMNILGRRAQPISVLVLGGGDGGIATHALKYSSVGRVLLVELDAKVTSKSRLWFPAIAAGLSDPRCEVLHANAIAWVEDESQLERFDLIVIDFTDDPMDGLFTAPWFTKLRRLLRPGGLVSQNFDTLNYPRHLLQSFEKHSAAFETVYPLYTHMPDYNCPYFLALSTTSEVDPLDVDWSYWEEQGIVPDYYSAALHRALLTPQADMLRLLGLPISLTPGDPAPLRQRERPSAAAPADPANRGGQDSEASLYENTTQHAELEVLRRHKCGVHAEGGDGCLVLRHDQRSLLGPFANHTDEALALPAMTLLGSKAKRLLVLGGGAGGVAALALHFQAVERLVVVDIDAEVVRVVQEWFPQVSEAFGDPRVEVVVADALEWVHGRREEFDAIWLGLLDQYWVPPSRTKRLPQTFAFMDQLRQLLAPHGLLVQDIGSIASPRRASRLLELHRAVFFGGVVWPMTWSALDSEIEYQVQELDGTIFRPPRFALLSSPTLLDPLAADWEAWSEAHINSVFYHPSIHQSLFVLPADMQRRFNASPPAALIPLAQGSRAARAARALEL